MTFARANVSWTGLGAWFVKAGLPVMIAALALAATPPLGAQGTAQEDTAARDVIRVVQDASRALQARNAASFLSLFDRERFADYPVLETHVVALTTQSDIASSVETVAIERDEDGYRLRVDWLLQLSVQETPGPLETRREVLELTAAQQNAGRWRITSLKPVGFFRPQGALPPPQSSRGR